MVGFILLLAMGLLGTIGARVLQTYELKMYAGLNPLPAVSFLEEYVGSEIYVWQVRSVGCCCMVAAGVLFHAVLLRCGAGL
jgi:hypothetical protein